jgi:ABC-type transport system involved in multi-copper enzyme maturation permease subunit
LCYSCHAGKETIVTTALRFLQIFSLGAWVGSIVYFIVFTAGIFPVVNNNDLTGVLVGYALGRLHTMGIIAGVVYLLATVASEKSLAALVQPAAVLVFVMIVCTMASQYGIIARMDALKLQMGSVSATPVDNPLRAAFDRLHQYSVRVESIVLLSGLAALVFTARQK